VPRGRMIRQTPRPRGTATEGPGVVQIARGSALTTPRDRAALLPENDYGRSHWTRLLRSGATWSSASAPLTRVPTVSSLNSNLSRNLAGTPQDGAVTAMGSPRWSGAG
jgi:hypothetical protein